MRPFFTLQARYGELMRELKPAIQAGLSAAIYTQTTDVESEVNGLMTYDRDVVKFEAAQVAKWHSELRQPVTMALQPEFEDAVWKTGNAPFADASTKQYKSATNWSEGKISRKRSTRRS